MRSSLALIALLPIFSLTACTSGKVRTPGGDGGDDTGGSDTGGGGSGWEDLRFAQRAHRESFGEGFALRAVDLDGDGEHEALYGGRGLAAIDRSSVTSQLPRWEMPWPDRDELTRSGDNDWIMAIEILDLDGDEVDDAIVLTSIEEAFGVSGATGEVLWHTVLDAEFTTPRMALFDGDDDGIKDFFPSGGRTAYSGATGEPLWSIDSYLPIVWPLTAELDGAPGDELLLVRELEGFMVPVSATAAGIPEEEDGIAVYAMGGDGSLLWTHQPFDGPLSADVADLDGDGIDEVVLGLPSRLEAAGADGTQWLQPMRGLVVQVETGDSDQDGEVEVYVGMLTDTLVSLVERRNNSGHPVWEEQVSGSVWALDLLTFGEAASPLLMVSAGTVQVDTHALALEAAEEADERIRWLTGPQPVVMAFDSAVVDGEPAVFHTGSSARLEAVHAVSGEGLFTWVSGGFITQVAAADLDGDGVDELLHGDDRGHLGASSNSDGTAIWTHRLDVGVGGSVTSLVAGDVEGDGQADIFVGVGRVNHPTDPGLLVRYDSEGEVVFSVDLPSPPQQLLLADLVNDDALEIIQADATGGMCSVMVRDSGTGELLWRRPVADCARVWLDVGDADGDGELEIAYADTSAYYPVYAAMIDAEGNLLWKETISDGDSRWVQVVPGGMVHGGFANGDIGHTTVRALADGAVRWRHELEDGGEDPSAPGHDVSGASLFGGLAPDLDGDGKPEILTSNRGTHDVRLLDGATGEPLWVTALEEAGLPWTQRHEGSVVKWVAATDDHPAYVLAAEFNFQRSRSTTWALDIRGNVINGVQTGGWAEAAALATPGPIVGGGLGLRMFEVVEAE